MFDDLSTLLRLLAAWASGKYTAIPYRSIVLAVAAVLYFVWPLDAIPDFIPVIGYVDDAFVMAFVVKSIKIDLGVCPSNSFVEVNQHAHRGVYL
jgi:uncharacterized membrane protein YkvA (DUF1232 family)